MKNGIRVSPVWTKDLVARRAAEFIEFAQEVRIARGNYREACSRFRARAKISGYIDKDDPKFHRATRKQYRALHQAKTAAYNAARRLETAVCNCVDLSEAI